MFFLFEVIISQYYDSDINIFTMLAFLLYPEGANDAKISDTFY